MQLFDNTHGFEVCAKCKFTRVILIAEKLSDKTGNPCCPGPQYRAKILIKGRIKKIAKIYFPNTELVMYITQRLLISVAWSEFYQIVREKILNIIMKIVNEYSFNFSLVSNC